LPGVWCWAFFTTSYSLPRLAASLPTVSTFLCAATLPGPQDIQMDLPVALVLAESCAPTRSAEARMEPLLHVRL
ncbi:hypothetical protein COO60DRAFT_1513463, partial [Scenedesmus sp. NREL 46B-D3]